MNILNNFFESINILKEEDELHLAFKYGYTVHENEFLKSRPTRFSGVFLNALLFIYISARSICLKYRSKNNFVKYYIFAGSVNQLRSLEPTIEELEKRELKYEVVYASSMSSYDLHEKEFFRRFSCGLEEFLVTLSLFVLRFFSLLLKLRQRPNYKDIKKYYSRFCCVYLYVSSFLSSLSKISPEYVLVANDHSVQNRCLIRAAKHLGIKTVFMQHGSGGGLLPPLEFDYAFLNGIKSLEKYSKCAEIKTVTQRNYRTDTTCVFLSGIKKRRKSCSVKRKEFVIGLAINPFDDIELVLSFIKTVCRKGISIVVRAHPAQLKSDLINLQDAIREFPNISVSDFESESTPDFISRIRILIAGKSSIHIEAGLSGRRSYFFNFSKGNSAKDLYGHIAGGVASIFPENYENMSVEEFMRLDSFSESIDRNLVQFSETHTSKWQEREGELVVETLISLEKGNLSHIYNRIESFDEFKHIYRLLDVSNRMKPEPNSVAPIAKSFSSG